MQHHECEDSVAGSGSATINVHLPPALHLRSLSIEFLLLLWHGCCRHPVDRCFCLSSLANPLWRGLVAGEIEQTVCRAELHELSRPCRLSPCHPPRPAIFTAHNCETICAGGGRALHFTRSCRLGDVQLPRTYQAAGYCHGFFTHKLRQLPTFVA
jgi:hypothetical protein